MRRIVERKKISVYDNESLVNAVDTALEDYGSRAKLGFEDLDLLIDIQEYVKDFIKENVILS